MPTPEPIKRKSKFIEPPTGTPRIYANQANLFWSGVDTTIAFGELIQSAELIEQGQPTVIESVKVTIPWSLAKLLGTSLMTAVTDYERKNGEVKFPGEYQLP